MIDLAKVRDRINTFRKKLSALQDEHDQLTNMIKDMKSEEQKLEPKPFEPYAVVYINSGFVTKIIGETDNDLLSVFGDGSRAWLDKRSSIKIMDSIGAHNILTEIHGDPTMERVKKLYVFVIQRKDNPVTDYFHNVASSLITHFPELKAK